MPGLSDPRGLWPLPSLPSPSPPWSQAPVEVFAAALLLGESGGRGHAGGARPARAHSAVTFATDAAVASSRWLCLPHVFFSSLSMLTSLVLPTCLSLPALCPSLPWSPSRMSPVPSSGCGFPYCECLTAHSSRPVIACSLHSLGVLCRPGTTKPQLSLLLG